MAINQTPSKDLIEGVNIKTMRKDLKRLREADAVLESRKIIQAKPESIATIEAMPAVLKKPTPAPPQAHKETPVPPKAETVLETLPPKEERIMEDSLQYASETEKQQIFLLKSELKKLQEDLQSINQTEEPPLLLQKNDLALAQEKWQTALRPLITQEEAVEEKQRAVDAKEKASNVPAEQAELEKQRWKLEEERQAIEKKRWIIEKELASVKNAMQELEATYLTVNTNKKSLVDRSREINEKMREIFANAIGRESEKRENVKNEHSQRSSAVALAQKETERHQNIEAIKKEQKEYIQQAIKTAPANNPLPEATIAPVTPPIANSTAPEEIKPVAPHPTQEDERRRKFMEDVEAWVSSNKQDN